MVKSTSTPLNKLVAAARVSTREKLLIVVSP